MSEIRIYPLHLHGSKEVEDKLNYLASYYNKSKSAVIRHLINIKYDKILQSSETDVKRNMKQDTGQEETSGGYQQEN